jgi:hypothetical protein
MFKKRNPKMSLTHDEEFQIFKLIIDKYLWLGTIGIILGVYSLLSKNVEWGFGVMILLVSLMILLMFTSIILRHFDFKRSK